jgi:OHCU decarboxylase
MNMSREEFITRYGGIYEHSAWVAEQAWELLASDDSLQLADLFAGCVDRADESTQLELICAHPDLAGKAAVAGELTQDSSVEQQSAGIDQCTAAEFEQFQELNQQYKTKFNFPFVMAVRNSNRHKILAAFRERLHNDRAAEMAKAIQEIHKIAGLRFAAMNDEGRALNDD